MRVYGLILATVIGCGDNTTNFTQNDPDPTTGGGNPILSLSDENLEFPDLEVGILGSQTLIVTSSGDATLEISRIRLTNSANEQFYIQEYEVFTLEPESTKEIIVTATLAEEGEIEGELQIRSNHADSRDLRIPLYGYSAGFESQ